MLRLLLMILACLGAIWLAMAAVPPGRERATPPPVVEPVAVIDAEPAAQPAEDPDALSASELAPDAGPATPPAAPARTMPGPVLRPSPQYPDTIAPSDAPEAEAEAGTAAGDAATGQRQVTANRVNLRAGPGTGHAVIGALSRGARVVPLAPEADGWQQVRTEDGAQGWLATQFLSAP